MGTSLRLLLIVSVCLLAQGASTAQDIFINYKKEDGLPSNEIYQVHQDHNGIMWFATDNGIASFNGSSFTTFRKEDGLPDDVVFRFFPQEDGQIWGATASKELFHFHPDTLVFHHYPYNDKLNGIQDNQIRGLKLTIDGGIKLRFINHFGYITLNSIGLLKKHFLLNKRTLHLKQAMASYCAYLDDDFVFYSPSTLDFPCLALVENSARDIFEYRDGLFIRNDVSSVQLFQAEKPDSKKEVPIGSMINDIGLNGDQVWVASRKGLDLFMAEDTGSVVSKLEGVDCSYYFEDLHGGQWISTLLNGVYFYPNTALRFVSAVQNNNVNALGIDENDNLVVGLRDHELYFLNNQLEADSIVPAAYKSCFENYNEWGAISNSLQSKEFTSRHFKKLSDNKGLHPIIAVTSYLYLPGAENPRIKRVGTTHDAEFLNNRIVLAVDEDIVLYSSTGDILKRVGLGVVANDIDVHNNQIYCATKGRGVLILDSNLVAVDSISAKGNILSNNLSEVLIDGNNIWIGGSSGVSRATKNNNNWTIENISVHNGLLLNEVTDCVINQDTMFIGTPAGLYYFALEDWNELAQSSQNTFFFLKSTLVNHKTVSHLDDLSYTENHIEVAFDMAGYPLSKDLQFQYKLIGLDTNWNTTGDRSITYRSLPPGQYELQIQPSNNEQLVNRTLLVPFTIREAYFRTWWFRVATVLIAGFIVWLFFKYRILAYNREIIREILRNLMKMLKGKNQSFTVRSNGYDVKVSSSDVRYVESNGNYINIYTNSDKIVVREKLANFKDIAPDPIEYLQIRRSVIVRLDQISHKSADKIRIGEVEFKVGNTYMDQLKKIQL